MLGIAGGGRGVDVRADPQVSAARHDVRVAMGKDDHVARQQLDLFLAATPPKQRPAVRMWYEIRCSAAGMMRGGARAPVRSRRSTAPPPRPQRRTRRRAGRYAADRREGPSRGNTSGGRRAGRAGGHPGFRSRRKSMTSGRFSPYAAAKPSTRFGYAGRAPETESSRRRLSARGGREHAHAHATASSGVDPASALCRRCAGARKSASPLAGKPRGARRLALALASRGRRGGGLRHRIRGICLERGALRPRGARHPRALGSDAKPGGHGSVSLHAQSDDQRGGAHAPGRSGLLVVQAGRSVGGGVSLFNHVYFVALEEPGLEHRFGAAYRAYKASVPRWVPRLPQRSDK